MHRNSTKSSTTLPVGLLQIADDITHRRGDRVLLPPGEGTKVTARSQTAPAVQ